MDPQLRALESPTTASSIASAIALVFGFALLIWGITPGIIERAVQGNPADLATVGAHASALLIGALLVGVGWIIRQGRKWSLWLLHGISVGMVTLGVSNAMLGTGMALPLFPLVLAALATVASWWAIVVLRQAEAAKLDLQPVGALRK
jgi:hypothetical protein